jgi:lipoprotein-anchoring transpeptidase ErfK/SrfK
MTRPREDNLLVCYRRERRLELWDTSKPDSDPTLDKEYVIAVGAKGYRTDPGVYRINSKDPSPIWTKPRSSWVPKAEWGQVVGDDDPANPIVARWLGFGKTGEGLHGTRSLESLGTAASHGCIRLDPKDIIELYPLVPKGTILTVY